MTKSLLLIIILMLGGSSTDAWADESLLRQLKWGMTLEKVKSQEDKSSKLIGESRTKKRRLLEYEAKEFQTDVVVTYYFTKNHKKYMP